MRILDLTDSLCHPLPTVHNNKLSLGAVVGVTNTPPLQQLRQELGELTKVVSVLATELLGGCLLAC